MAKVIFDSFIEASAFSKNLAMAIKTTISIHRDGDTWWVEDIHDDRSDANGNEPGNINIKSSDIDLDSYDANGFKKVGYTYIHKDTGTIFDPNGYDAWGRHENVRHKYREYSTTDNDDRVSIYHCNACGRTPCICGGYL